MSKGRRTSLALIALVALTLPLVLTGCASNSKTCYYGYFGDSAYSIIYMGKTNSLYFIKLPLEQIRNSSGADSIPTTMRNYVGMKDSGFLVGTPESVATVKDILDALGSESEEDISNAKRLDTLVAKAQVLSKKPLLDKINQLCGQDVEGLLKLLADREPECRYYDAQSFFKTDDLNFSQRYFSQWLEQVLGGDA